MNSKAKTYHFRFMGMALCFFLGIHKYAYADTLEHKQCDANITKVIMEHFNIPSDGDIRDSACKIWPFDKNKTLAALAYAPPGYDFAVSDYSLPYYVAVIDTKTRMVIATYKGGILEDGTTQVTEYTLSWDTARYDLAKGIRGFALRVSAFSESPAMNGGFDNQLTLFVIDGNKVRPVIKELNMHEWECDIACGDANAKRIETRVEISVGETKTNGLSDLILAASRSGAESVVSFRAQYNGSQYKLSGWHETRYFSP